MNGIDIYWFMQSWAKHCVLGSLADLQKGRWQKWFPLIFGSLSISIRSQTEWAKGSQLCTDGHQFSIDQSMGLVTVGSPCSGDQSGNCCVKVTFGWQSWAELCVQRLLSLLQTEVFEKSSFLGRKRILVLKACNAECIQWKLNWNVYTQGKLEFV